MPEEPSGESLLVQELMRYKERNAMLEKILTKVTNGGKALTLETLSWIAGILCSIVAGTGATILWAEGHYAKADTLNQYHTELVRAIAENRKETGRAADDLRKQLLEDKIFELNLIPDAKRTDVQRALLERYKAQVNEINMRWSHPPKEVP